jgi:hypothetical protein
LENKIKQYVYLWKCASRLITDIALFLHSTSPGNCLVKINGRRGTRPRERWKNREERREGEEEGCRGVRGEG